MGILGLQNKKTLPAAFPKIAAAFQPKPAAKAYVPPAPAPSAPATPTPTSPINQAATGIKGAFGQIGQNAADNFAQRWGQNPGETIPDKMVARQLDKKGDVAQRQVDNWGNAGVVGGWAQKRLDDANSQYKDKFDIERNSITGVQFPGATHKDNGGNPVNENPPIPPDLTKITNPELATMNPLNPGEVMADDGMNNGMLDTISGLEGEIDNGKYQNYYADNNTENAADQLYQDALTGGLTDPANEFYKARTAQMDTNAEDARQQLANDLSWNRDTGGGIEGRRMADLELKLGQDKNALMAESADKYAMNAGNWVGNQQRNALAEDTNAFSQNQQDLMNQMNQNQWQHGFVADTRQQGQNNLQNWANIIGSNYWKFQDQNADMPAT